MAGNYEKGMYKQLLEVMERLDFIEKDLKVEKREHKEDVDRLNNRIGILENENLVLKTDNERLKRIINNDSSNTSLPPSTDQKGKPANTYNGREKSGKKAGAQKGHKGTTLTKLDVEEKIKSGKFKHTVEKIGSGSGFYITKYIMDLEIISVIREIQIYAGDDGCIHIPTELKSDVTYGSNIKGMAVDLYAEGVMSNERIVTFLNTISENSFDVSSGSIYGFIKDFFKKSNPSIEQIENELLNAQTVCTDATVVTLNGKQAYIRNTSTDNAVRYYAMESKSIKALGEIEFMNDFSGNLVHDHETALYHYGTGHGECNVHLLRYLKKNTQESNNKWSSELSNFLCNLNKKRKICIESGQTFTESDQIRYSKRYREFLEQGIEENKATKGKLAKSAEKTLLNRLKKYKKNHLLFLRDFTVPFENNMSERDLRKCKNRQKISGGFRKNSGNEMYCSIMSFIETCKRKKMQVLENIKKVYEGKPAIF